MFSYLIQNWSARKVQPRKGRQHTNHRASHINKSGPKIILHDWNSFIVKHKQNFGKTQSNGHKCHIN